MHLDSGCVHAGQQMPAGGPQMGPEMMDQIQQRLSDPATADLISAFTQTMRPEDLAGMLKSGGMDVTPEQVGALCLPAEASDLSVTCLSACLLRPVTCQMLKHHLQTCYV